MSGTAGFFLITFVIASFLVPGIILIRKGRALRLLGLLIPGWCLIATISTLATFGLIYLIYVERFGMLWLLISATPLLIIAFLVATLTICIDNLAKGFHKDKDGNINKNKITAGFVLLGINSTVLASIIILIVLFMNGFIPIALM